MSRLKLCIALALAINILSIPTLAAPPDGSGYSWKLVFGDDFEGSSLNRNKWISQLPWTRDYKGDAYIRDENVTLNDGILTITAKAENYSGHEFTSGAISTGYSKFKFKYGYVEARINMPSAQGSWCNFWMLSDGWPPEVDIVEYPLNSVSGSNNQRYRYLTNIHYGTSQSNMATHWKSDLSAGYHNYAFYWRPWYLEYYFDDNYLRSISDFEYSNNFGEMYLILDYYVGGEWSGEVLQHPSPTTWPNPATSDAGKMQIDWVRVWQRNRDTQYECVGWWTLDEEQGTNAADSSGHGMNGTLMGDMSFESSRVNGNLGTALNFDGVDDYIDLPDGFSEFDNGCTFTLWAKPSAATNYARFIEIGNGQTDNSIYLAREGTGTGLRFKSYGGTSSDGAVIAENAIELDRWQFFAATIDSSGNVSLYKNGELIKTGKSTWPWGVTRRVNYIGRSSWTSDAYYQGAMDEVRVFDFSLSASQIKDVYTNSKFCSEPYPDKYDLNWDCQIDITELSILIDAWLNNGFASE